jgi:hypothetical protein
MAARDSVSVDRRHQGLSGPRLRVVPDLAGREADAWPAGESLELVVDSDDDEIRPQKEAEGGGVVSVQRGYPVTPRLDDGSRDARPGPDTGR